MTSDKSATLPDKASYMRMLRTTGQGNYGSYARIPAERFAAKNVDNERISGLENEAAYLHQKHDYFKEGIVLMQLGDESGDVYGTIARVEECITKLYDNMQDFYADMLRQFLVNWSK